MDYENKYKEALSWMQSLYDGLHGATKEDAEHYFPELKESEDERIRKEMISWLKGFIGEEEGYGYTEDEIRERIAWLEKQGEQNHCNGEVNDEALQRQFQIWFDKGKCSGRDEVIFHPEDFGLKKQDEQKRVVNSDNIKKAIHIYLDWLDGKKDIAPKGEYSIRDMIDWLKSLENRVQPCPKQEWSVNDERILYNIHSYIDYAKDSKYHTPKQMVEAKVWLDSLKNRVQPHWKPTEEQMSCFKQAIDLFKMKVNDDLVLRILNSLYDILKKL